MIPEGENKFLKGNFSRGNGVGNLKLIDFQPLLVLESDQER